MGDTTPPWRRVPHRRSPPHLWGGEATPRLARRTARHGTRPVPDAGGPEAALARPTTREPARRPTATHPQTYPRDTASRQPTIDDLSRRTVCHYTQLSFTSCQAVKGATAWPASRRSHSSRSRSRSPAGDAAAPTATPASPAATSTPARPPRQRQLQPRRQLPPPAPRAQHSPHPSAPGAASPTTDQATESRLSGLPVSLGEGRSLPRRDRIQPERANDRSVPVAGWCAPTECT
jgi:hypothetical protein